MDKYNYIMLHITKYTEFINESSFRHSHGVTIGKVISNANNPNEVIRVNANSHDEFIINLNKELASKGESLPDIKMLKSIRNRLTELDGEDASTDPYPKFTMDDLKRKLHYYDGSFPFLLSTRNQLKTKGKLTNKQWEAVYRSFYGKDSKK